MPLTTTGATQKNGVFFPGGWQSNEDKKRGCSHVVQVEHLSGLDYQAVQSCDFRQQMSTFKLGSLTFNFFHLCQTWRSLPGLQLPFAWVLLYTHSKSGPSSPWSFHRCLTSIGDDFD